MSNKWFKADLKNTMYLYLIKTLLFFITIKIHFHCAAVVRLCKSTRDNSIVYFETISNSANSNVIVFELIGAQRNMLCQHEIFVKYLGFLILLHLELPL